MNATVSGSLDNEVKLENDFKYNASKDSQFKQGIVIKKENFVINGQGHSINASGQARIFIVDANNVTLKNITFLNGFSEVSGGAILFDGNYHATIENCIFINNSAVAGAAVRISGSDVVVKSSNFTNNRASQVGGAIYSSLGGTVENCNFDDNKAVSGGAIYVVEDALLVNNNFTNNSASSNGGAVFLEGVFKVKNNNFKANKARVHSGAIYVTSLAKGSVEDSCFESNEIISSNYGGAIYINVREGVSVNNSKFVNNSAYAGGALYFVGSGVVENSNFTGNKAHGDFGGAILQGDTSSTISIKNSNFNNNYADRRGGAVYSGVCVRLLVLISPVTLSYLMGCMLYCWKQSIQFFKFHEQFCKGWWSISC